MSKHLSMDVRVPIEEGNPAIRRIESLCIKCGQCRDVCQKQISVGHHYDLLKTYRCHHRNSGLDAGTVCHSGQQ